MVHIKNKNQKLRKLEREKERERERQRKREKEIEKTGRMRQRDNKKGVVLAYWYIFLQQANPFRKQFIPSPQHVQQFPNILEHSSGKYFNSFCHVFLCCQKPRL